MHQDVSLAGDTAIFAAMLFSYAIVMRRDKIFSIIVTGRKCVTDSGRARIIHARSLIPAHREYYTRYYAKFLRYYISTPIIPFAARNMGA